MTKHLLAACALLLSGCDRLAGTEAWSTAPLTHVCSRDEMERVEHEALWCKNSTDYISTYCYGAAIMRNCKPMPNDPPR